MDARSSSHTLAALACASLLAACGGSDRRGFDGGATPADAGDVGMDAAPMTDGSMALDGGVEVDGGSPVDGGAVDGGGGTLDGGSPGSEDPSLPGPYPVAPMSARTTSGGRTVPLVAHLPMREDAVRSPLVVFHPGFLTPSSAYASLCDHVASHGFVVVRAEPPSNYDAFGANHLNNAADLRAAIDWSLATLAADVDASRIAAMGHSVGGKVAVMVAADDPRVRAVLTLDPVNGGGPLGYTATRPDIVPGDVTPLAIPLGFMGETTDATGGLMPCAPTAQNFLTFYAAATSAPWVAAWTFEGARHMDFVTDPASCGLGCSACMQGPAASSVAARTLTLSAAFFLRHFEGQTALEPWLTGARVPTGVTVMSR